MLRARTLYLEKMAENIHESSGEACVHSKCCRALDLAFISLGGDHTIVLPILRSLYKVYGQPISVIHFGGSLLTPEHIH